MALSELQLRNYSDLELVRYLADSDNAETRELARRLEQALDEPNWDDCPHCHAHECDDSADADLVELQERVARFKSAIEIGDPDQIIETRKILFDAI